MSSSACGQAILWILWVHQVEHHAGRVGGSRGVLLLILGGTHCCQLEISALVQYFNVPDSRCIERVHCFVDIPANLTKARKTTGFFVREPIASIVMNVEVVTLRTVVLIHKLLTDPITNEYHDR